MRLAALYDIHGNLPALEAVLEEVQALDVDRVIVGGDVWPGPMANECLERLQRLRIPLSYVRGNGERETLAAADGLELTAVPPPYRPAVEWGARQLSADQVRILREWPATQELEVPGLGSLQFCHATPDGDTAIVTRLTPPDVFARAFSMSAAPIVVCGHTHMPFDREVEGRRVLNAGSVGMPFGRPGADWLYVDGAGLHLRHTNYDLERAAARIRDTKYPGAAEFATSYVLQPPSEQTMLTAFGYAP
jgi:predicted phosphodiesterase